METPQTEQPEKEKVEVFSVIGSEEKSWSVDKYQLYVGLSIVSVIAIMGGIVWLASGGTPTASGANPLPTGELKFDEKKDVEGTSTQQELPYPSVRGSNPLRPGKATTANPPAQTSKPTPTTKPGSPAPTATPTPNQSQSANPTATPVPATPTIVAVTELKIEDITVGTGEGVKNNDTVRIHYTGTLTNGTKFDSSYDRGTPFETKIGVGQVIEGWDKGVIGMKVGGKRKLSIPANMAYGANPPSNNIPANAALIFEMELIEIK